MWAAWPPWPFSPTSAACMSTFIWVHVSCLHAGVFLCDSLAGCQWCHMSAGVDARIVTRQSGDTFCSVRAIKRGSGALVNTEERDSARRQQHSSAWDNMIRALLGPPLSATRRSTGDAEATLHSPHGSYLLPSDLLKEVIHRQIFLMRLWHWRGCSTNVVSGKIICTFFFGRGEKDWQNVWAISNNIKVII